MRQVESKTEPDADRRRKIRSLGIAFLNNIIKYHHLATTDRVTKVGAVKERGARSRSDVVTWPG